MRDMPLSLDAQDRDFKRGALFPMNCMAKLGQLYPIPVLDRESEFGSKEGQLLVYTNHLLIKEYLSNSG